MKLEVLKSDGSKAGRSIELPDDIFGIEPNEHIMWLSVKQYLANQRQGTHKALEKSEVSGSTKKLHKQKGTGGSRKGSIKSPLFRGGARVFGPRPRDYSFKVNVKEKDLARRSALSQQMKENKVLVIEDIKLNEAKTKECSQIFKNLGLKRNTLLVANNADENLKRASRNIAICSLTSSSQLNAYSVLKAHHLLFTESSIKEMK